MTGYPSKIITASLTIYKTGISGFNFCGIIFQVYIEILLQKMRKNCFVSKNFVLSNKNLHVLPTTNKKSTSKCGNYPEFVINGKKNSSIELKKPV